MSEETTTTPAVETPVQTTPESNGSQPAKAPKARKPKAKVTKPKPRKASKPKAAKKPAKPATKRAPRAPMEGLRKGQVRILHEINKSKSGMLDRNQCSQRAKCTPGWVFQHLGATEPKQRAITEKRAGYKSLLTLSYVRTHVLKTDDRDVRVYEITASGKKALAKALAEAKQRKK